jgi:hypothetical protein
MKFLSYASNEEKENAWDAYIQIEYLSRHIAAVQHALALFHFAYNRSNTEPTERPMLHSWMLFGTREAAIIIDDFYRSLTAARSLLQKCKDLWVKIERDKLEEARRQFEQLYPEHLDLRNAACHQVDYSAKPHNFEKNSVSGAFNTGGIVVEENQSVMMSANISGNTVTYSGGGILLKLDMTPTVVENLERVRLIVLSCFDSLNK